MPQPFARYGLDNLIGFLLRFIFEWGQEPGGAVSSTATTDDRSLTKQRRTHGHEVNAIHVVRWIVFMKGDHTPRW